MDFPEFYYCYEVLYWCGVREGEMLALTLGDIDFHNKTISISKTLSIIHGKEYITSPKTVSSIRTVRVRINPRGFIINY